MNNLDLFGQEKNAEILNEFQHLVETYVASLELDERVTVINEVREMLHKISPFSSEPVDFV